MFQPQPTPFASSCFASYGLAPLAPQLDLGLSVSAGGGGAGTPAGLLYGSQLPQPQAPQSRPPPPPPPQQHRPLPQRQLSTSSPVASSPFAASIVSAPASAASPSPSCTSEHFQLPSQAHPHPLQHRQPRQPPQQPYISSPALEAPRMDEQQGQHDIAAQQAAAKDYQIVHEGPLVGDKASSDAITNEYAKADPVYVGKTIALPQTYSHYRPIQGDGNCGWRAIGFSYFEKLIESGDQGKVESEVARLMSVSRMITNIGGYSYVEDFSDEMFGLLREIAQNMGNPHMAYMVLMERWNDAGITPSIIYYLRLLSATYLKANATNYEPFLQEGAGGVHGYCAQTIEPPNREIEHLGIIGLANMLLQPIDFVLEIVYLDRSAGSQANTYRFPEEANNQDVASLGPIIYLLYRPDHYDILYRTPPPLPSLPVSAPVPPPPGSVSMQINRASNFTQNTQFTSTPAAGLGEFPIDYGTLSMLGLPMGAMAPPSTCATDLYSPAPVQHTPWMPQFTDGLPAPTPLPQPQPPVMASPQPPSPPTPMSSSSAMASNTPMVATSNLGSQPSLVPPQRTSPGYHIRFSQVQLEYEESKNSIEPHFNVKTNTFKNSIWNRAHYGNPDFHPEEWSPEDEHVDGRVGGKRKFKKESS